MVFFSCDRCSEALKKNQVEKHGFKCRNATYSCLDCGQAFSQEAYKGHIKCLTESRKYGGKNYVEKENKGEAKQNRWIEQVERAIENVEEPQLKDLLEQIRGFDNIPRKEAKFVNFLQNSIKIRNRDLCIKAWNCISKEAKRIQEEEEEAAKSEESKNDNNGYDNRNKEKIASSDEGTSRNNTGTEKVKETGKEKLEKKKKKNGTCEDSTEEQGKLTVGEVKKFKWKRAIKRTLSEAENGQMKIKRLRRMVIGSYLASCNKPNENDTDPKTIFNAKLQCLGLHIDGKMVRLR